MASISSLQRSSRGAQRRGSGGCGVCVRMRTHASLSEPCHFLSSEEIISIQSSFSNENPFSPQMNSHVKIIWKTNEKVLALDEGAGRLGFWSPILWSTPHAHKAAPKGPIQVT